ncbi:hypothetical protein EZJ19_02120 [Parasulfuritortus cantonensis]|uniref:YprB ribonuclease H-like domain-containing protein n=1 Tax=Parasulfuritortus cantonensis TaxID=2528202 RepID=A0A4R1BM43_9PROT|nr:ribonuclease H-like domain-containing protein [Parasulfuritortus cantonensis]TCJ18531.1 hypothetical protein EZJ19_02120 [Parasulfuritortus cantonensis]
MDLRQRIEQLKARQGAAPAAPDTDERLKRLLDQGPRATKASDDAEVAARLGGTVPATGVVLVEHLMPLGHRHGRVPLTALLDAPLAVLADVAPAPDELLFLDTETTGLAGGTGTLAFLLGLARLEADGLRLRQYFLTGFGGEAAMLEHARPWLAEAGQLVTYNGKSFDVPLLVTRHRLRRLACPLDGKPHIDLLHPTRAAFASRWQDCRLQRAEVELLGLVREDDLPGWLVPQVWGDFVRTRRLGEVARVLEHNRLDVVSLAALLAEMARIHARPGYANADAQALARRQLKAGRPGQAIAHLDAVRDRLGTDGLLELARLHRREARWPAALAIWQPLAEAGVVEAMLALAKYREHVERDFAGALALCSVLVGRQPGEPEYRRREARLRARLAASEATSTGGPSVT